MKIQKMKLQMILAVGVALVGSANLTAAKERSPHRHHKTHISNDAAAPTGQSSYGVYTAGTYVGSDPDLRARAQLQSDFNRGATAAGGMY